jgi:GAF domain-containing protein
MSEDAQSPLQRSVAELSTFLVSNQSLADTLTKVASLAAEAVPRAAFAGITMIVDDQVTTQGFTDPIAPEVDRAQYESGRGPCLDAFKQSSVIIVETLQDDDRWPEFATAAVAHGVRSTMSIPMLSGGTAQGALNFYAGVDRAFGEAEVDSGMSFATHAAAVLANAQAYWGARLTTEHLQQALNSREEIDMAKGMIMNVMGCSPSEAFEVLVKQSQQENRKLREIAAEIVARADRQRRS